MNRIWLLKIGILDTIVVSNNGGIFVQIEKANLSVGQDF